MNRSEKPQSPEIKKITDQEIIDIFNTKGVDNPEARELYSKWYEQNKITDESPPGSDLAVRFALRLANVYSRIGDPEEALSILESADEQAEQEGLTELRTQIQAEIDKLTTG